MKERINKNLYIRLGLLIVYVLCWIGVYNLPRRFFHTGGHDGIEPWIIFVILFVLLPFLLYLTLLKTGISKVISKGLACSSILLVFPISQFIKEQEKKELEYYQNETIGIVEKAWLNRRGKRGYIWSIKGKYQVDGKLYQTSSKDDKDKLLKLGDTIRIIYSSKTPEISEIKELMEYYE